MSQCQAMSSRAAKLCLGQSKEVTSQAAAQCVARLLFRSPCRQERHGMVNIGDTPDGIELFALN
jgi:hypothetical protein